MKYERTTQELWESMSTRIKHCGSYRNGVSKEELRAEYDELKHVSETLTYKELKLLWYLRNSTIAETHRFLIVAKKKFDANMAFLDLDKK